MATSYASGFDLSSWNYNDRTNLQIPLTISSMVSITLVLILILLRLYVRMSNGNLGHDDWLMGFAALTDLAMCSCSLWSMLNGFGKHLWIISEESGGNESIIVKRGEAIMIPLLLCNLFYTLTLMFVKLSIIQSYLRTFFLNKKFLLLMRYMRVLVISLGIVGTLGVIFESIPVQSAWDWDVKRIYTINIMAYNMILSGINSFTDVILCLAPGPILYNLHTTKRKKIQLYGLYGVGLVACTCGIVRIPFLRGLQSSDLTYTTVIPLILSTSELTIAIGCGCAPSLMPIIRRVAKFVLPTSWYRVISSRTSMIQPPIRLQAIDHNKVTPPRAFRKEMDSDDYHTYQHQMAGMDLRSNVRNRVDFDSGFVSSASVQTFETKGTDRDFAPIENSCL